MKTKQRPQEYVDMLEEITENFKEYLDEGCDPSGYILSLLHQERKKNFYLTQRIEYFEKRLMYAPKNL